MINLLEVVHRTLFPFFNQYSPNSFMTISQFEAFIKDFGIIPEVLPIEIAVNHFTQLNQFSNETDTLDEYLFVETLALCALDMKFEDP